MRGLEYATVLSAIVALTGAAAFELVEPGQDYFDGLYWAVQTMTTVGYGTPEPTNTDSRVVALVLMLAGVVYFAVLTGALAERFTRRGEEVEAEEIEAKTTDDLGAQVDRLALRARELVTELEALRLALPAEQPRVG